MAPSVLKVGFDGEEKNGYEGSGSTTASLSDEPILPPNNSAQIAGNNVRQDSAQIAANYVRQDSVLIADNMEESNDNVFLFFCISTNIIM